MYSLKPGVKEDPVRYWALPDRIFFGFGACHILTGVYLQRYSDAEWAGLWIKPMEGFRGNHVIATNGDIAFDFHGCPWRIANSSRHRQLIEPVEMAAPGNLRNFFPPPVTCSNGFRRYIAIQTTVRPILVVKFRESAKLSFKVASRPE